MDKNNIASTIGTMQNPSKYLHIAILEHITYSRRYFINGSELLNPTPEKKLVASIFGHVESKEEKTEVGRIAYRTVAELNTKFYAACEDLGVHSSDVRIK